MNPPAIAEVAESAWPLVRDADELHDAMHPHSPWQRYKKTIAPAPAIATTRWGDSDPDDLSFISTATYYRPTFVQD